MVTNWELSIQMWFQRKKGSIFQPYRFRFSNFRSFFWLLLVLLFFAFDLYFPVRFTGPRMTQGRLCLRRLFPVPRRSACDPQTSLRHSFESPTPPTPPTPTPPTPPMPPTPTPTDRVVSRAQSVPRSSIFENISTLHFFFFFSYSPWLFFPIFHADAPGNRSKESK